MAAFVLCSAAPLHAQQNLFNHLYWRAKGQRPNQEEGYTGLSYLGKLNDSVHNAVAIGEVSGSWSTDPRQNISGMCFNNGEQDTGRHFEFPGNKVIPCNLNGDAYRDYVVWSSLARRITVLYGTANIDSFTTACVLQKSDIEFEYLDGGILVADCDSDGYDDLVVSDAEYRSDGHTINNGHILFYKGGPTFDAMPTFDLQGASADDYVGGRLSLAHVRDRSHMFLCEHRAYRDDLQSNYYKEYVFLYPLGRTFSLHSTDTILCSYDWTQRGDLGGYGFSFDADADSVDDIEMAVGGVVLVYKGGEHIDSLPTYQFVTPVPTYTTFNFGTIILDIGDISGHGYHSMLVTDPEAGGLVGAVYIYNLGKALKDSCVAYAFGQQTYIGYFGTQAIAIGDVNHDGLSDVMVSALEDTVNGGGGQYTGAIFVFLGNASYGPTVDVDESNAAPLNYCLLQNFPNPGSTSTEIQFSVNGSISGYHTVEVKLYDMLGRELKTLFRSEAPQGTYILHVACDDLATGLYYYRLRYGEKELTKTLSIIH